MEWKNIIIGILVGYVFLDILLAHNNSCPSIFVKCVGCLSDSNKTMLLVAAVLIGVAAWWLASLSQEHYTFPEPTLEE